MRLQCRLGLDRHRLQHRLRQLQQQHVLGGRRCHVVHCLPDRQHERVGRHDLHMLWRLRKQRHRGDVGVHGLHGWVLFVGFCGLRLVRRWLLQPSSCQHLLRLPE